MGMHASSKRELPQWRFLVQKEYISNISKAKYLMVKSYFMKNSLLVTAPFFYKLLKYNFP